MDVKLEDGSTLKCQDYSSGRGTEGEVYFSTDGKYAVKLYNTDTDRTKQSLQMIMKKFNPVSDPVWRPLFCWPEKIVTSPRLGIAMPRAANGLRSLDSFLLPKFRNTKLTAAERGDWAGHVVIAGRMARLMTRLHLSGLCYADPSWNNFLVDPRDGRITAIDLDGLVVHPFLPATVQGTKEFQAPELVMQTSPPSVETDLHALAVLIYRTLMFYKIPGIGWGSVHPLGAGMSALQGSKVHPGNGAEENDMHAFGDGALFIEHPTDHSNRPKAPFLSSSMLGTDLEKLIREAFNDGLFDPKKRPQAPKWEQALVQLLDRLIPCSNPACEMKSFPLMESGESQCPWCNKKLNDPRSLAVLRMYRPINGRPPIKYTPDGNYMVVAWPGRTVHEWHIDPSKMPGRSGVATKNRAHFEFWDRAGSWHLVNDDLPELAFKDGNNKKTVAIGSSVELRDGVQLTFGTLDQSRLALVQTLST